MSLYFLLFAGTTPIGSMLVGLLATRLGVQPTILLLGLICLSGVAGTYLFARQHAPREGSDAATARVASSSTLNALPLDQPRRAK